MFFMMVRDTDMKNLFSSSGKEVAKLLKHLVLVFAFKDSCSERPFSTTRNKDDKMVEVNGINNFQLRKQSKRCTVTFPILAKGVTVRRKTVLI